MSAITIIWGHGMAIERLLTKYKERNRDTSWEDYLEYHEKLRNMSCQELSQLAQETFFPDGNYIIRVIPNVLGPANEDEEELPKEAVYPRCPVARMS